jgi:hypothetical protein
LWKIGQYVSVYKQYTMPLSVLPVRTFFFIFLFSFNCHLVLAQSGTVVSYVTIKPKEPVNRTGGCSVVMEAATFPGGEAAWVQYLIDSTRYPTNNVRWAERILSVRFIVSRRGACEEVQVLDSLQDGFAKEAIRVIRASPRWNVAKRNGRPTSWPMVQGFHFVPDPPIILHPTCDSLPRTSILYVKTKP